MSLGLSGLKIGPKNQQKIAVLWPKIEKTLKFNNAFELLKLWDILALTLNVF